MAVSPITSAATGSAATSAGVNSLSGSDFLNLMLNQLEHQDPLSPTDSNALLTQISQISTLQSNQQMVSSLQASTLQQSIGAAGNMIGRMVVGANASGDQTQGVVVGIRVEDKNVILQLDNNDEVPLQNIEQVVGGSAATQNVNLSNTSLNSLAALLAQLKGGTTTGATA